MTSGWSALGSQGAMGPSCSGIGLETPCTGARFQTSLGLPLLSRVTALGIRR